MFMLRLFRDVLLLINRDGREWPFLKRRIGAAIFCA
jgi:hypothetical protein